MNFKRRAAREDPEINLIPLIDVLLVILIFLMVTTTYSRFAELKINLPTAQGDKQPEKPNEINVGISASGQLMINRNTVTFQDVRQLAGELTRAAGGNKEPLVIINADAKAEHQWVVHVMEASRMAGYTHVSFAITTPR